MSLKEKTTLQNPNKGDNSGNLPLNDAKENEDAGYVKKLITEQDVYTSGVVCRYINNVDPNKDLITDTAKIGDLSKL